VKPNAKIRVATVDDHPIMRDGIAALVNSQTDMTIVAGAADGKEALLHYREHQPAVVLMDLRLPDMTGIDAMSAILKEFLDARVIILTTFAGDAEIRRALSNGASGYVLKTSPPDEILTAIRRVNSGKRYVPSEVAATLAEYIGDESLTEREIEVLRYVADGNRNRDIAASLFISEETVKVHMKHIMDKLGASDRTQAVSIAIRRGIIEL
jgi:DNA-binding NarL/FixJ family response regulator